MVFISQLLMFLALLTSAAVALWPIPSFISTGTTPLKLSTDFSISTTAIPHPPSDLLAAIQDVHSRMRTDRFQRLVVGRGATDADAIRNASHFNTLELSLVSGAPPARTVAAEATLPLDTRSEWYNLSIPSTGLAARLVANSTLGLFRGLTTFSQLWYAYGTDKYILEAPVEIGDRPAFVSVVIY